MLLNSSNSVWLWLFAKVLRITFLWVIGLAISVAAARGATTQPRYYAHEAVEDEHGVIAPWYQGTNGQCDERIRVAVATLKRYPWTPPGKAPKQLPEYIYSGAWRIDAAGNITIPPIDDWANGDLAQRAAYVLGSLIDYYRYSGDAWAIDMVRLQADALLDYSLTPDDHPWPRFLVSVPVRGKPYGQADPRGMIQLDIAAEVGIQLVRASQLCREPRYLEAAQHWADLLAEKRIREPGVNPWPRYANPQDAPWEDIATGGVTFILEFFDTLIAAGYTGRADSLVAARQAGVTYLRDTLLPNWLGHDTWGRNYWDWPCGVQVENVTEFTCRYLMDHPQDFPDWQQDARNIATLFINRTSASSASGGDTFHGAWAYPESSGCCGRSLWYGPLELAQVYAQYASLTGSEWARELARRQLILATYDFHPTGVVEDNIDGGAIVADAWFKIAHPMALKHCLGALAWMPELLAPPGENHLVRSTRTVTSVRYERDRVSYSVHGQPGQPMVEVLRLSGEPRSIREGQQQLKIVREPQSEERSGAWLRTLEGGDCILTLRHQESGQITIDLAGSTDNVARPAFAWGAGGGPTDAQRWIFGYPRRSDYVDQAGNRWRPATEWVVRSGNTVDTVASAWYATPQQLAIRGTEDPELYRYGAHAAEFWADVTVGPGTYHVTLKFAETRRIAAQLRAVTVIINGEELVTGMDIAATAAQAAGGQRTEPEQLGAIRVVPGMGQAVDLVFNAIQPQHGIISIRLKGSYGGEAMLQAIEVGPGQADGGAVPVTVGPDGSGP